MNKTKQLSEGPGSFNVATGALEVTPSDTEDLKVTAVCRYLWVGVAGNIKVTMINGDTVTMTVPQGYLWGAFKRVWLTGTTASGIIAFA